MNEKNIILTARIASMLLTPFYLPVLGILAIFFFSDLSMFPWQFKVSLVVMVYLFTVFIPTILIHLYRQYHGWTLLQLGQKERRIGTVCYFYTLLFWLFLLMNLSHLPHLITSILIVRISNTNTFVPIINVMGGRFSTHTAAIGGVLGALLAFSFILNFNSVWWLCLVIIASGIVGSSRIILRQHTLTQVTTGFFLGIISAFFTILLI